MYTSLLCSYSSTVPQKHYHSIGDSQHSTNPDTNPDTSDLNTSKPDTSDASGASVDSVPDASGMAMMACGGHALYSNSMLVLSQVIVAVLAMTS